MNNEEDVTCPHGAAEDDAFLFLAADSFVTYPDKAVFGTVFMPLSKSYAMSEVEKVFDSSLRVELPNVMITCELIASVADLSETQWVFPSDR